MVVKPPALHPNQRPDLEKWISSYEVEWAFVPGAPIEDIDIMRSLKNQARIEPIDEATVERYEIGWRTGSQFPPIVVNRSSRSAKLTIISGNHRVASAIKANLSAIDRYEVIGARPAIVGAMCREANNFNGLPPSEEERILNAIFATKSQNMTLKDAASLYQVPLGRVQRRFNETSALQRAQEQALDLHAFMKLSQAVRTRLAPIEPDEIFKGAAELAIASNLSVEQINELATSLSDARSFKQKQGVLAVWRKSLAEQIQDNLGGRRTSNARKPKTRRQRFSFAMGQIKIFGDDLSFLLDAYSANELPELVEDIEEVVGRLQKFVIEAKSRA